MQEYRSIQDTPGVRVGFAGELAGDRAALAGLPEGTTSAVMTAVEPLVSGCCRFAMLSSTCRSTVVATTSSGDLAPPSGDPHGLSDQVPTFRVFNAPRKPENGPSGGRFGQRECTNVSEFLIQSRRVPRTILEELSTSFPGQTPGNWQTCAFARNSWPQYRRFCRVKLSECFAKCFKRQVTDTERPRPTSCRARARLVRGG